MTQFAAMRWLAIVVVLGSCGEDRPAVPRPAPAPVPVALPPASPPPPPPRLEVTLDGAPLAFKSVYAYATRDGLITIEASSHEVSCEYLANLHTWHETTDAVEFELGVRHELVNDGSRTPFLTWTTYNGYRDNSSRRTKLVGDGAPGSTTSVDVDVSLTGVTTKKTLRIKGTLDAKGCKVDEPAALPLPPAQPATITAAGTSRPVRFAAFTRKDELYDYPTLWLYTGSERCGELRDGDTPSELLAAIVWMNPGDPEVGRLGLHGTLIGSRGAGVRDGDHVIVKPRPSGAGRVTLDIDTEFSGMPVQIKGTVHVVPCETPP